MLGGYFTGYKEEDIKFKIGIWDETGVTEIIFFNMNESEKHAGLYHFNVHEYNLYT